MIEELQTIIEEGVRVSLETVVTERLITGREMISFREPKVLIRNCINTDAMLVQLYDDIWKQDLEVIEDEVSYPATWFQHLKQTYFPDWYTKRWPVMLIKKTLRCQVKAYYPEIMDKQKPVFKVHRIIDQEEE